MRVKDLKFIANMWLMLLMTFPSLAYTYDGGSMVGGGGDSLEMRVTEIRVDILKWIKAGGAKGLNLPREISYKEYYSRMIKILENNQLVIGFVQNVEGVKDDIAVSVEGVPKTCRGFISRSNSRPHILCSIERFQATSESDQYKLIHHEFAGLVGIEKNEGAASDYIVSSQITKYLTRQSVLRLAVKPNIDLETREERGVPSLEVRKNKYLGNRTFEVQFALTDARGVVKLILDNKFKSTECYKLFPRVVLSGDDFVLNRRIRMPLEKERECDDGKNAMGYDTIIVQYENGDIEKLNPLEYNFPIYLGKSIYIYNYHDTSIVRIMEELNHEEEGTDKDHYGFKIKSKRQFYDIRYEVSPSSLSEFRGVIFENGEEFLSEDPQELADFINSRTHNFEIYRVQETKVSHWLCYPGDCLINISRPVKNKYRIVEGFHYKFKLIMKGDVSSIYTEYKIF